MIESFELLLA